MVVCLLMAYLRKASQMDSSTVSGPIRRGNLGLILAVAVMVGIVSVLDPKNHQQIPWMKPWRGDWHRIQRPQLRHLIRREAQVMAKGRVAQSSLLFLLVFASMPPQLL